MMKHYTITVNGTAYDVTVEEKTGVAAPASPTPAASAVSAVPVQKPAPAATGCIDVKAGAAGKVFNIPTTVGQKVKRGEPVIIIEAMKMENEIISSVSGIVDDIFVSEGKSVNSEEVLLVIK